jgi:hypothetical protein
MTDDEVRLSNESRRAGKAKEILDNELFKEAVRAIEEALLFGIRQSAFKDKELREKLCDRYSVLHEIVGQLRNHIETGELAIEEIRRRTVAEKLKEFLN